MNPIVEKVLRYLIRQYYFVKIVVVEEFVDSPVTLQCVHLGMHRITTARKLASIMLTETLIAEEQEPDTRNCYAELHVIRTPINYSWSRVERIPPTREMLTTMHLKFRMPADDTETPEPEKRAKTPPPPRSFAPLKNMGGEITVNLDRLQEQ